MNMLEEKVSQIKIPSSVSNCRDVKCRDLNHKQELDIFTLDLLETVQEVAEQNLPVPASGNSENNPKKTVPGWGEAVKPFKEQAYFWHQVWLSCGRPQNTEVHRIMKRTRNKYHYEYRKCCKAEDKMKKNKLLGACLNGDGNLFKEIKTLRKCKPVVASSMDGKKENIKEHFKEKYADDALQLRAVEADIESKVNETGLKDVLKVTPEIVKQAAHKLKSGKSDPVFSFSSDCLKNATKSIYENISLILQSFLVHGHLTNLLLLATLVPIIKDKLGSINISKNYRSIAIISIILKLIDWVFILLFGVNFALNDL